MKISIPRELTPHERRVAITPDSVQRLITRGFEVLVQRGAGAAAHHRDADYQAAGARLESDVATLWAADLIVKIRPPADAEIGMARAGATLISLLDPLGDPDRVAALAARGVTAIAADLVPRSSLAQMMDVLTSQASIAGYRAVLLAAEASPRLFPRMRTAAGTISPARVLVLGAGVAGLQAIATARRLGAIVEAFDVRAAAREQVESLGARFVEVPSTEDGSGAGGYAREVSDDYKRKQAELVGTCLARADACITTALIPGRPAPVLITAAQVAAMRPGAVIVDLAAERGGNCELTRPGQRHHVAPGVAIIGDADLPAQVAVHASQTYARNMEHLVAHVVRDGALVLDASDPIVAAMLVCRDGEIVHPKVAAASAAVRKEIAA